MDNDTTRLEQLLEKFCLDRISMTEDFAETECLILDDLYATLCKSFARALESFDEQLFADQRHLWKVKDKRYRSILTEFGDIHFCRRVYIDECGQRRTLLDELMALRPHKRLSPGAFEALAYFGNL